jgi:hypothetical protein
MVPTSQPSCSSQPQDRVRPKKKLQNRSALHFMPSYFEKSNYPKHFLSCRNHTDLVAMCTHRKRTHVCEYTQDASSPIWAANERHLLLNILRVDASINSALWRRIRSFSTPPFFLVRIVEHIPSGRVSQSVHLRFCHACQHVQRIPPLPAEARGNEAQLER